MLSRLRRIYTTPTSASTEPSIDTLRTLITPHITAENEAFITDACLHRYLKARTDNPQDAYTMLQGTLKWREAFKPQHLGKTHVEEIKTQAASGKMFVLPKTDHNGRAVIIMRPGLENSSDEQAKMRYLVYTLERAAALADAVAASDGKFVVVVDYFSGKVEMKNSPGFSVMKEVAAILQGHYPERLGGMLLCDAPGFFEGLYRLVRPFLHPVTREKIVFVRMRALERGDVAFVDWEGLPRVYGGDKEYEFDVDEYFGAV